MYVGLAGGGVVWRRVRVIGGRKRVEGEGYS